MMFGRTIQEVLANKNIDIEDKARVFKCFKRMYTSDNKSKHPLKEGDPVTITGLLNNKSLNGETGVLGSFKDDRWAIPSLSVRVRPENIFKKEWMFEKNFNTSVTYLGRTYILRIDPDQTVRCITPTGIDGRMMLMKTPWDDLWLEGFNRDAPEESDLFRTTLFDERASAFFSEAQQSL